MATLFGNHAIASCSATGDKIRRHDILRNRLFDAASAALLAPRKEVRGLDLASQQKPGDVVISNWELSPGSTRTAFDVTVASPMTSTLVKATVREPRAALTRAYQNKRRKYRDIPADTHCVPLAVTTFGAWDNDAIPHLKAIASHKARNAGKDKAVIARQLMQQLSVSLQRENSALLAARCPSAEEH